VSLLVAAGGRRAAALLDVVPELATARSDRLRANRLPALRDVVAIGAGAPPGCLPWDELRARAARVDAETLRARRLEIRGSDPAVIMFTSGTTGMPKGVVLSHRQIVNGGMLVAHRLRYTAADRVCLPLPLHHVLGNVAAGVAALTHGCALVLPCDTFDAPACLAAIEGERCTSLYGVPTMFLTLLEHATFDTRRTVSLRTGVVSGMSCPPDLLRRIVEQLRVPQLTVGYGMTEMAPILFSSVDDSLDDRASTTGKVQPHVECMVVDPATGRPAPRGERGEVVARGYCVMQGYWQDPEATRQTIDAAGWLHTGDLGVMRRDGSVSIVGRLKDLVIRGGENIAPREIEELLREHPKVADAQVIGVPDREYGEELCAWIRLRDNQTASRDELRQHCRTRLAAHKIPRHICFASEFPTTASGKVQRFRLQEMAIAALNLYTPDAAANAAYDRRAAGH
jgi:fatty-acyl-CoA synthase